MKGQQICCVGVEAGSVGPVPFSVRDRVCSGVVLGEPRPKKHILQSGRRSKGCRKHESARSAASGLPVPHERAA